MTRTSHSLQMSTDGTGGAEALLVLHITGVQLLGEKVRQEIFNTTVALCLKAMRPPDDQGKQPTG